MNKQLNYEDIISQGYQELFLTIPESIKYNCMGCSPTNLIGLGMRFYGSPSRDELVCKLLISENYCGYPTVVHGGIICLIADEMMAHLPLLMNQGNGVTKNMQIEYKRPVFIGHPIYIRAEIIPAQNTPDNHSFQAQVFIHDGNTKDGPICCQAKGTIVLFSHQRFQRFLTPK